MFLLHTRTSTSHICEQISVQEHKIEVRVRRRGGDRCQVQFWSRLGQRSSSPATKVDLRECSLPDSAITNTPLLSRTAVVIQAAPACYAAHLIFNNPHSWTRLILWPEVVKHSASSSSRQPAPIYMKDWEEGREKVFTQMKCYQTWTRTIARWYG